MDTGLAAASSRLAWGYCPGCYKLQDSLGLLAWLLQAPGSPEVYWPGCYRPKVGLRGTGLAATGLRLAWGYWLLLAPGWPGGTVLAATSSRIAWGYWPGCYRLQVRLRGTGLAATGPKLA